jgi:pimeloyl-ACP methyl ester carboxylesterase
MRTKWVPLRAVGLITAAVAFLGATAAAQSQPVELRYHLNVGDRLVYRVTFDKQGTSPDTSFHSRMAFSSQLVVLDAAAGSVLAGVQRNRLSADLLEYRDHGKDTLELQKPGYVQRLAARPVRFGDANVFSGTGEELLAPEAVREANSKLLYRIQEIMPLPGSVVQAGSEWDSSIFGLHLKVERFEDVGPESCAVVADTGSRKETHLQFTFCPSSGHLAHLEFEGHYQEFDSAIHERVTFDLESAHQHETVESWLENSETRVAALNALLISTDLLPTATVMNEILRDGTHDAQSLALALYYQRKMTPGTDALAPLLRSDDEEVRRLAGRFTEAPVKPAEQPCELPAPAFKRERPGTTLHGISTPGHQGAPYMIHVPLDYRGDKPFPLIVYLSGGGGLAFDAASHTGNAVKHAGYLLLFPHAGGDLWWEAKPTEMVHALLLEILRTYNVDTNRVYLVGWSNGGTAALEYGTRWPDRFAAIASLMGAGLDTPSRTALPLQNLEDVPVLFLHGDKDPLIPPSSSYTTESALRRTKPRVSPELHILKGRGHDISLENDDDFTLPFLERYVREPFPSAVTAKFFDARYPRQYWVEVLEGNKGAAEVQARILEGNLVDIEAKNVKKLKLLLRPELISGAGPIRVRVNGKEQPAIELRRDCKLFQSSAKEYEDPFLGYTDEVVVDVP